MILSVCGCVVDAILYELVLMSVDVVSEVVVSSVVCIDVGSDVTDVGNGAVVDLGVTDDIVGVESVATSVLAVVDLVEAVIIIERDDVWSVVLVAVPVVIV